MDTWLEWRLMGEKPKYSVTNKSPCLSAHHRPHFDYTECYICSSLHRNSRLKKSNKMQHYADNYLLPNYSTCFGHPSRQSSGMNKTVVTASGTDHTVWGARFLKRDQIRTYFVTFEEACSPYSMICTRGCNCSVIYSWWWARWPPETRRVI